MRRQLARAASSRAAHYDVDVVVVGAGAAGAFAATEAARRGASVLCIEVSLTTAATPPLTYERRLVLSAALSLTLPSHLRRGRSRCAKCASRVAGAAT